MDDSETKRIWHEYGRRRTQAFAMFVAALVAPAILALVARAHNRVVLATAFVVLVATYVCFGIAVLRFWNWKCPQCRRRFIGFYGGFSFLRRKCFHCGLRIGVPGFVRQTDQTQSGASCQDGAPTQTFPAAPASSPGSDLRPSDTGIPRWRQPLGHTFPALCRV